jgi:hypothetical protein
MKAAQRQLEALDRKVAEYHDAVELRDAEKLAATDATVRQYLETLQEMEFNLARLGQTLGPKNRTYLDAKQDVALQRARIDKYVESHRQWAASPPSAPASRAATPN